MTAVKLFKKTRTWILLALAICLCAIFVYAAGTAPYFTPTPPSTLTCYQNSTCFYDFNATDDQSDPYNFSIDTPPFSENIDADTGILNFTPNNDQVASYPNSWAIVKETDTGNGSIHIMTFVIVNINDVPFMTNYSPSNLTPRTRENALLSFNATADDIDIMHGDNLTYTWLIDGVVNLTLLNYTNNSANYTPDFFSAGLHNITINVTDNQSAFDSVTWEVNVSNENRAPINNDTIPNITMVEDVNNYSFMNLSKYFYDLDWDDLPLTFDVIDNDNITAYIHTSDPYNVTFVPDSNFNGVNIIRFRAFDGYNYTLSNNVTVNVSESPDPPVIEQVADQIAFVGVLYQLQIVASDPDEDTLTYYDNATMFNINPTSGFISFTPLLGDVGNHSINISASEGIANTTMIFNLSIIQNSVPVIGGTPLPNRTFTEDDTVFISFNATDGDLSDTLTFWSTTNKTQGASDLDITTTNSSPVLALGNINFEPDQDDVGSWSVTVHVNDSKGAEDTATFILNITDVQHDPILLPDPINDTRCKVNLTCTLGISATDSDEDLVSFGENTTLFNISTSPGGLAASKTGAISFTPNDTDFGEYQVNITINDSFGNYDWQVVLFNITYNSPPVLQSIPDQNATEDSLFSLQANASDPDPQDTLLYYDNTSLFNISATGLMEFTPNSSQAGNYSVNITVGDGEVNVSRVFNISIGTFDDFPFWNPALSDYYVNETTYYNTTSWTSSLFMNVSTNRTLWNSSVYQDNLTIIYMDAYDEESSTLMFDISYVNFTNASNDTITAGIPEFINFSSSDGDTALANMTPNNSMVGSFAINFSVRDESFQWSWSLVDLTVHNINDLPIISNYSPNTTALNMSENTSQEFNVTAYDIDYGDIISYRWLLDDTNISGANQSNYTYSPDFLSAGMHNLTVMVLDLTNESTNLTWTINVSNVNRVGTFGTVSEKLFADFNDSLVKTNVSIESQGNVILDTPGAGYYPAGSLESSILDMHEDNYFHYLDKISWYGNTTDWGNVDFNVTFQTRTAASVSGSCPASISSSFNGSSYTTSNSSITSSLQRCIQYKLVMATNDTSFTPNISTVKLTYGVDNYSIDQDSNRTWIYVTDYFDDPDTDDNLTYNMSLEDGSAIDAFNYSITAERIFLSTTSESVPGEYEVVLHMDDGHGTIVDSNVINIEVIEAENTQQPITTPSGGGGSVMIPQEVEVDKEVDHPVSFKLITPKNITTHGNDTIEVPLNLFNTGNFTLLDVDLEASSVNPNVELELSRTKFSVLEPRRMEVAMLKVKSSRTYGSYIIRVKAKVKDPDYTETVDIFVNSLLKSEGDEAAVNTKIAFASDLLSSNQECLELNEFLKKAQDMMGEEKYAEAAKLIDQVVESCKYLVAPREKSDEVITSSKIYGMPRESAFILVSVSILTLIVMLALVIGWAHIRSKRKERMKY